MNCSFIMNFGDSYDVIVIGAGAAGLIAAGRAASLGATVLLVERMRIPGRKLLITGKGRCNITNIADIDEFLQHIYPNHRFLRPAFNTFFSGDMISLLRSLGVETTTERGGRVFPEDNKSSSVLDALVKWNTANSVKIATGIRVTGLIIENNIAKGILVEEGGNSLPLSAKSVIICTGGKSYPATGSTGDGYKFAELAGHTITPLLPSLVPLETMETNIYALQGLALKNINASVWINGKKVSEEFGEMLFTHFGLSGPVILTLSRQVAGALSKEQGVEISIDLKPALDMQKLDNRLQRDLNENGKKQIANLFRLWLPSGLVPLFMELLSVDPQKEAHQVNGKERKKTGHLLKDLRFGIKATRSFKEAIITRGGVHTNEINPGTMESRKVKNLYFAGEVIDLDADTGGYNLQIAWSTGWLAGSASWQSLSHQPHSK